MLTIMATASGRSTSAVWTMRSRSGFQVCACGPVRIPISRRWRLFRLALNGVGATMHCHNSLNADRLAEEAAAAIRAAADVGVRLALSCPLLDFDPWAYGGGPERLRPFLAPDEWPDLAQTIPRYAPIARQIEAVDEIRG